MSESRNPRRETGESPPVSIGRGIRAPRLWFQAFSEPAIKRDAAPASESEFGLNSVPPAVSRAGDCVEKSCWQSRSATICIIWPPKHASPPTFTNMKPTSLIRSLTAATLAFVATSLQAQTTPTVNASQNWSAATWSSGVPTSGSAIWPSAPTKTMEIDDMKGSKAARGAPPWNLICNTN